MRHKIILVLNNFYIKLNLLKFYLTYIFDHFIQKSTPSILKMFRFNLLFFKILILTFCGIFFADFDSKIKNIVYFLHFGIYIYIYIYIISVSKSSL